MVDPTSEKSQEEKRKGREGTGEKRAMRADDCMKQVISQENGRDFLGLVIGICCS